MPDFPLTFMKLCVKILRLRLADVAELADALVSGSSEAIHVGSNPVIRTKRKA